MSIHVPAPTAIYTLSLHDVFRSCGIGVRNGASVSARIRSGGATAAASRSAGALVNVTVPAKLITYPAAAHRHVHQRRSEEHTSELQSHSDLVCRLLLEKKKQRHM